MASIEGVMVLTHDDDRHFCQDPSIIAIRYCAVWMASIVVSVFPAGNNTYGADIPQLLSEIGESTERTAYILMERVHPAPSHNYAVRAGQPTMHTLPLVSELGIYGTLSGKPVCGLYT